MPGNHYSPRALVLTDVDATSIEGLPFLRRGGAGATLTLPQTQYTDVIDLLNGRGSAESIYDGTSYVVIVTSTDKVLIYRSTAFALEAGAGNAQWGMPTAGASSSLTFVAGAFRQAITGTTQWRRQAIDAPLVVTASAVTTSLPADPFRAQDVITALRVRGVVADVDDVAEDLCIEDLDLAEYGPGQIRWFLDDDGHVVCTWPDALGLDDPEWVTDTGDDDNNAAVADFARARGFTGSESSSLVSTDSGDIRVYRGTWPDQTALITELPPGVIIEGRDQNTVGGQLSGPDVANLLVYEYPTLRVPLALPGPGASTDLSRHFIDQWLVAARDRVTLYQQWPGEPRRALALRKVGHGQDAYDLLYTSERDGRRGRIICARLPSDERRRELSYENTSRRLVPIELRLSVVEGP